jgi:hypoxanthine phosphoribosyltransferase
LVWLGGVGPPPRHDSHSAHSYEGALARRWVFVDDLIDSGDTYFYVREAVENYCLRGEWRTTYVGAYLYNNHGDPEFLPEDA